MEDKKKKKLTIPEIIEEVQAVMCDRYCKFHASIEDEEELLNICEDCPLLRLG